jgi:(p)ppGpp synthase/HD superfamily hydrolase
MEVVVTNLEVTRSYICFKLKLTLETRRIKKQVAFRPKRSFIRYLPWQDFKILWIDQILWIAATKILLIVTHENYFYRFMQIVHDKLNALFREIETNPIILARIETDRNRESKLRSGASSLA